MKNADYWRGRFGILEDAANSEGAEYLQTIESEFRKASQSVQDDIERWYGRFATNNGITLADAKKWLTSGQLAEFKWSVQDYIKAGESLNPQFLKQLENASARVHISRLEALQFQMQQQIELLYGNHVDDLDDLLRRVYSNGYYHTAFELQRGMNLGWDLQSLNPQQLQTVLSRPWSTDMRTFRDRCWTNKTELVGTLQTQLTQAIIRGDSPDKITKAIADRFNVSKNKAGRLAMTESAYFSSQAQKDCFNELDVEQYEIVSALDEHTCEICGGLDGKVFRMPDYEPGVTANPFHPWCRCCTAPYFDDNAGERAARNQEGQVYYVPANIKYPDWKNSFLDDGNKVGLTLAKGSAIIITKGVARTLAEVQRESEKYARDVRLGNIQNIDSLNELNGTLEHLSTTYPGQKLKELKVKVNRTGSTMASANFEGLYPRSKFMTDPVTETKDCFGSGWTDRLNKKLETYQKTLAEMLTGGESGYFVREYEKAIKEVQSKLKFSRHNVIYPGKEVQSVITHEYGHILADQLFGQINHKMANPAFSYNPNNPLYQKCQLVDRTYQQAVSTGDIHSISLYGSKDSYEFFAECFTMYDMGMETLPDYIMVMFKEVLTT